jgi:hypothetical protein
MSGEGGPGGRQRAGTLAAVVAAVQAYLKDEGRAGRPEGKKLSAWKTAQWRIMRGGMPPRSS